MKQRTLESELKANTFVILALIIIFLVTSLLLFIRYARIEQKKSLATQANYLSEKLHFEIRSVKNNLFVLRNLMQEQIEKPNDLKNNFKLIATNLLAPYKPQYNVYFALEKKWSLKAFKENGYVYTLHRNISLRGKEDYYHPETFTEDVWPDPGYQKNDGEVWYHVAKKSKEVEFSKVYFDDTYMKKWLITAGIGLYKEDEFRGMVGIDLALDDLTSFVESFKIGKTGGAILVNEADFRVIASSKRYPIVQNDYQKLSIGDISELLPFLEKKGKEGYYITMTSLTEVPWKLIIYQGKMEADEKILIQSSVFGLLIICLIFILYIFNNKLSRRISSPVETLVNKLQEDAEIVTKEGYINSSYVGQFSIEEINVLGNAVNKLIEAINRNFDYYKSELGRNQKLMDSLDQKVSEQTHELAKQNEELQVALDELGQTQEKLVAQEKLASLGNLTAGIAHEIKNPLNLLVNGSKILIELQGSNDPDDFELSKTLAEQINQNSKRLTGIVNSMLSLTRTSGDERNFVDIKNLVEEICLFTLEAFKAKTGFIPEIKLRFPYEKRLLLSREEFSRAMMNLIDNALYALQDKFSKDTSRDALLEIFTDQTFNTFDIHIKDNGSGIKSDNLKRIFDPFFTTKPPGAGTGLGMSFVHDIITRHRGEVKVFSSYGEFTEVVISFPLSN